MVDKNRKYMSIIKKVMLVISILLTLLGGIALGVSIYLKGILNSEQFLEIADESIVKAAQYIKIQEKLVSYGIIGLVAGVLLLVITLVMMIIFKKKK